MEKYYTKIKPQSQNYEQDYWGIIKDPDGNVRDRLQEREKFLKNIKTEIDYINNLKPSKILDAGCGLGFLLSGISDKHEKYGLEVSEFAVKYAEKFAKIKVGKLEDSDYEKDSFDVVISHHVIEHTENPEKFLLKIKEILKPDGKLIIATPDFDCVCARLFKENYRMLHDKTHVSLFSFKGLKKMLEEFDFEIEQEDFPYFETEYFTDANIEKMLNYNSGEISPACFGNFMTFYCTNKK